ncbi:PEP/pyruvate-binding domain-containing protein [Streptomyces sp. NPDC018711]|uniref:PEP/pyruvate-binding domain-containing protein n=1 Tax=Streptomyces sp. NPDC018711 TaxID=3365052 RepID=UPI0037A67511
MSILTPLTNCDPSHVGAKAAALGRLQHAGLPVPDSVVIPTGVTDGDLAGAVKQVLNWAERRAPYGLIARSSAPGEDGATASFAGLYASVITPCTPAQALAALREVRASASTQVVAQYAAARGLAPDGELAVLIQPVLRPALAGVLAAVVHDGLCVSWRIEAVRGLAEPLVNGTQTGEIHIGRGPTTDSIASSSQTFLYLPGTQEELDLPPGEWITVPSAGRDPARAKAAGSSAGVLHLRTPAEWVKEPVLLPGQREELLSLAVRAAQALGLEQIDMEWAITTQGPTVLQARPLTRPISDATASRPPVGGWAGLAAVTGTATGPAIHLGTEASPNGAVLICRALGPEAAAALLGGPAAVVSTTGGPLSHTAIIARELGIPCVTNVPEALHQIPQGMALEVDGSTGTVRPAPTIPAPRKENRPVPYADAAIVTTFIPDIRVADGRMATLVLHDPHLADLDVLVRAVTAAGESTEPLGILLPDGVPPSPVLVPRHPGFDFRFTNGLAVLWPKDAGGLPHRLVALDADSHVIFERLVNRSTS